MHDMRVETSVVNKTTTPSKTTKASKTTTAGTAEEAPHVKAECALREHPALGRWLRQLPSGRLAIDRAKIAAEERLDGKYLLSTSDPDPECRGRRVGLQEPARGRTRLPGT